MIRFIIIAALAAFFASQSSAQGVYSPGGIYGPVTTTQPTTTCTVRGNTVTCR